MNRIQERKLSMYEVTQEKIENFTAPTIVAKMPQFSSYSIEFLGIVSKIKETGAVQVKQREGIATEKQILKESAVNLGLKISLGIRAFGINQNNETLIEAMSYRRSKLGLLADNILVMHLNGIKDVALENLANLGDYHITQDVIIDFEKAIRQFDTYIPKPRAGIVEHKDATALLAALFAKADALLVKMDALADVIADQEPEFFSTYKSSRILVDAGYRTIPLRGFAADENGLPVEKAKVFLKGTKLNALTTVKGNFQFRKLPEGVYDIVVQKNGFEDANESVAITDGERMDLKIEMRRV
ncbi:hypothetical protein FNO01nite_18830 [Flavobacterium noncentrifugens]|uniref:Carboxypeptidase regulatory-like domain-containing protein n=1 Tax=Flavobacterium noncentrifugens TaxID=1128970 RepID=A0A1G8YG12_9FLAO|nr:carboxypeptidase-like regulatory domain-containing protein [Flavobacterium noncentrifugens]GEP51211.1 hypothetical protein FNO01nite_18830 [Flavobacterium noncentrifugens]SDK01762.1 Carboxypeptidase regulatory-like domain-containing protein [Flavobacterium noncentrifugens]